MSSTQYTTGSFCKLFSKKVKIEFVALGSLVYQMDPLTAKSINHMINSRMSRVALQPGIQYIKIIEVNGKIIEEDVGMFVRSYRMGSGDGTTIHWEFNKDGVIKTIDDELWGSVNGSELTYYRVK